MTKLQKLVRRFRNLRRPATSDSRHLADFSEVTFTEEQRILERRRRAGFDVPVDEDEAKLSVVRNKVGLAFSGGGIRSAAFNLGILQALQRSDLLRHIDYLSTVSGGGYIAAHLSALATRFKSDGSPAEESSSQNRRRYDDRFTKTLLEGPDGRLPSNIKRLIAGGMYLYKPTHFFSRYCIGWIFMLLMTGSFMTFLTCGAALLFRCLDVRPVLLAMKSVGLTNDVSRAFLPAILLFLLWLSVWVVRYWRRGPQGILQGSRLTSGLFMSFLAAGLMALAALMVTGDIAIASIALSVPFDSERMPIIQDYGRTGFVVGLVVALLPYFRINDLIRSATRPANVVESWAFKVASHALLFGVPLFLFGVFAQENFSACYEGKARFTLSHVEWEEFLERLRTDEVLSDKDKKLRGKTLDEWLSVGSARSYLTSQHSTQTGILNSLNRVQVRKTQDALKDVRSQNSVADTLIELCERTDPERWEFAPWKCKDRFENLLARDALIKFCCQRLDQAMLDDPQLHEMLGAKGKLNDRARSARRQLGKDTDEANQRQPAPLNDSISGDADEREDLRKANWEMLAYHFNKSLDEDDLYETADQIILKDPKTIFASAVTNFGWNGDQLWRLFVCLATLIVFAISVCVVNLNETSLHSFYRDRLTEMWIRDPLRTGNMKDTPLVDADTTAVGLPYHLINATMNRLGRGVDSSQARTDSFLFSQQFVGSETSGYVKTDSYTQQKFTMEDGIAISGAAVSPSYFDNPLLVAVLFLFNLRLGKWIPSPAWIGSKFPSNFVSALPVLTDFIRAKVQQEQRYVFVTDGGHHDNLGIQALLRRRCRLVIAVDAGSDPEGKFENLLNLLSEARLQDGVTICDLEGHSFKPDSLVADSGKPKCSSEGGSSDAESYAHSHFKVARIRYPDQPDDLAGGSVREGVLVYVRCALTGDENAELLQYAKINRNFPNDSTVDQFFDSQKFDSYRLLGEHIGLAVAARLAAGTDLDNAGSVAEWDPAPTPGKHVARANRCEEGNEDAEHLIAEAVQQSVANSASDPMRRSRPKRQHAKVVFHN